MNTTILSSNMTNIEEISEYDFNGAIIYIFGVLIWYALGFGLILIDDIDPEPGNFAVRKRVNVYQTVYDLHEQQERNEILLELKDKDRRTRLWQIYYGTKKTHPVTQEKDQESIELIIKQLNELNERRRFLRYTLNDISGSIDNDEYDQDDSDTESFHTVQMTNNDSRSMEQLKSYFT